MIKIPVKNQEGKTVGEVILEKRIFEVKIKPEVIHQAIMAQEASSRPVIAHTKNRGEVRGGGRKPWRQKGTGRARHGSIRSPIWRGGGVVFGPRKDRNYSKNINKKVRRLALAMSLSERAKNDKIIILDKLELAQPKTKLLPAIFKKLRLIGSILLVLPKPDALIQRVVRNLPKIHFRPANSLNARIVIQNKNLIITQAGLETLSQTYWKK